MVKHVALIIGCVILSLSAALIVPTSCSPISENEQKESNLVESRTKRQITSTSSASANSASAAQSQSQLLTTLLPYLTAFQPPAIRGMMAGGPNGLAGVIKGLNPLLAQLLGPLVNTLGGTVGFLGGTLDKTLDGLGGNLGILGPTLGNVGDVLTGLLGGGTPPKPGVVKPPVKGVGSAFPLIALLESVKSKADASSSSSASSMTQTTLTNKAG